MQNKPDNRGKRGEVPLEEEMQLAPKSLVRRLREIVRPPGKRGSWMMLLDDQQLLEVYYRLKRGQSANYVCRICQEDWGLKRGSSLKVLNKAMLKFRREALGDIELTKIAARGKRDREEAESITKRTEKLKKKVDGLEKLAWAIQVQAERLETLVEREKKAIPFKFTDKTVKTLGELLDTYLKYQIELGVLDAKPSEFNLNIKHKFEGIVQNALENSPHRFIDGMHKFLELAESKALTLVPDSEGTYRPKNEVAKKEER